MTESEAPGLLEGIADGVDAGPLSYAEKRTGDGWEEVGVFVGVEVRDTDSGALEFCDLGEGFALDVFSADAVAEEGLDEVAEGWAEGFAVWAEKRGDGLWR